MKKEYQKPWLVIENFDLVEHIASICSVSGRANHTGITVCGFDNGDPNGPIFLDKATHCEYNPDPEFYQTDEDLEFMPPECYYSGFSEDYIAFSS